METKDVLIGIALGLAIAWLFGSKRQTQTASETVSIEQFYQMHNRMQQLEFQLQQYRQMAQLAQQKVQSQMASQHHVTSQMTSPIQQPVLNTGYKNDEKWLIERGKDGHIKSLQIVRDAKVRKID